MTEPIDRYSWEFNAQMLIDALPAIRTQMAENTGRIAALERRDLIRVTAHKVRAGLLLFAGSLAGSVLTLALPYLLKYFFHLSP